MANPRPVLSIVTPWKDQSTLIKGYQNALITSPEPLEIVIVDNNSKLDTANKLRGMVDEFNKTIYTAKLIVNPSNAFFTKASNHGYAISEADTVCFLNSDIEIHDKSKGWFNGPQGQPGLVPPRDNHWIKILLDRIRKDADESAQPSLYGPAMIHKKIMVPKYRGSRRRREFLLPYLTGWCITSKRSTWESFRMPSCSGPWNDKDFAFPYWEDNELCLRATQKDIRLVQIDLQLHHVGRDTAKALPTSDVHYLSNKKILAQMIFDAHASNSLKPTVVEQCRDPWFVSD